MKEYHSPLQNFTTFVNVNGHIKTVKFTKESNGLGSSYTTSNEFIQKALEASSDFGTAYKLVANAKKKEEQSSTPTRKEYAAEYKAKTVQKAASILVEEYNIPIEKINSKADVLAFAVELNIHFPNL